MNIFNDLGWLQWLLSSSPKPLFWVVQKIFTYEGTRAHIWAYAWKMSYLLKTKSKAKSMSYTKW